jgi:tape measure domain-containing protein
LATVQSTLKLFDAMTRPLQNITQGMNMLISTMHQMQSATDRNVNIDKTLAAAKQRIAAAEVDIQQSINQANAAQQRFNNSVQSGHKAVQDNERSFSKMGASVVVLNQALELFQKIAGGLNRARTLGDDVQSTNVRLAMINDSLRTQAQLQQQVLDVANKTRGSYMATADMVSKLGMFTEGVFKNNDGMLSFAERFNKLLVAGGANKASRDIATMQMTQALGSGVLQGDELRSISEAAPLLLKTLADGMGVARGQLKKMGADGKLTADVIVKAFEKQSKQIDTIFEKMPMTFGGAMTLMQNKAIQWIGTLNGASGPLQKITQLVQKLTTWTDSKDGQKFFNDLSIGIMIFANAVAFVGNFVMNHMDLIQSILVATGIVLAALGVQMLITWIAAAWPVLLVIAAIAGVIYVLQKFGVTGQQMVGYVVGAFYYLYAVIYNQVAGLWNIIATFAEFLINVFIDPIYAIQKLIYDLDMVFYQVMYDMLKGAEDFSGGFMKTILHGINKVLGGFNWLTEKVNGIFGTDFGQAKLLDENNIHAVSDSVKSVMAMLEKPTSTKDVVHISRMQEMDLKGSFDKGYGAGAGIINQAADALKGLQMPGGDIANIGKVGSVGKIEDTVDISSEDLKVMRDLAEMKSIQNFVTLTPTVQVTTGPISKEVDVDEVIHQIKNTMETEIESSAKGSYDMN